MDRTCHLPTGIATVGMDLLEITLGIEEEFQVELSDDDLESVARDRDIMVGDLYELVLQKLQLRDFARHDLRLNYALWVEIQAALHSATDVPLKQIELKTPLKSLFPRKDRRTRWEALREASPYRIRKLDYPPVVGITGFLLAVGMVLFEQFRIWQIPGARWLWPLLGFLGIWMFIETYAKLLSILSPFRNSLPYGLKTVKELCRNVLAANYEDICQHVEIPLDDRCLDVWERLKAILVENLGIDAETITFRSRLIRDLGAA